MCNNAVNTCTSTIRFVLEYYKTHKMCDAFVNTCIFVFNFVRDVQEMYYRVVSEMYYFRITHCPYKYKTQGMCDEAVDGCLTILRLILNWFEGSKLFE